MTVVLVHPPLTLGNFLFNAPALSALGVLYTAGTLRRDRDVRVVDAFALHEALPSPDERPDQHRRLGSTWASVTDAILNEDAPPDAIVIAKTRWWTPERGPEFRTMLTRLRQKYPTTIVGLADFFLGDLYLPPYDPTAYLDLYPELDFVLHGAGETSLRTVLDTSKDDWSEVPGLAHRTQAGPSFAGFHYTDNTDLDSLGYPAYDMVGFDTYVQFLLAAERADFIQESHDGIPFLAAMATRGCNHQCTFCATPGYGIRHRTHSIAYLEAMFLWLHARSGVRKFILNDPALNHDKDFFAKFQRMMAARGFRYIVPNGLRADRLDRESLALLKLAQCPLITSLETPDYDFAKARVHKGLVPNRVVELADSCHAINLPLKVHYVVGMPGETTSHVQATLRFAIDLYDTHGAFPLVQVATPIPGSAMAEEVERMGWLTRPLSEVGQNLPEYFQTASVISTPQLAASQVTRMFQHFQHYILQEHPRELMIAVTFACNNRCPHCLFGHLRAPPCKLDDVVAQLHKAKDQEVQVVILEGGEPTLHPDLPKIISTARQVGMREVMMETNGRRCAYPAYAKLLFDAGLTRVALTLCGAEASVHDAATATRGSFSQTLNGLQNLLEVNADAVMVNIPIHAAVLKGNRLKDTILLAVRLGVRSIMLQGLSPFGRLAGDLSRVPPYESVLPALQEALAAASGRTAVRVANIPFCLLNEHLPVVHPDCNNIGRFALDDGTVIHVPRVLGDGKIKDSLCESCEYGFLCFGFLPMAPRLQMTTWGELRTR